MALLLALSERPGELWTRDELVSHIWAGASASDEVLTRIVYQLRKALTDIAADGGAVRTVSKQGYRLDAEIRASENGSDEPVSRSTLFPPFSVAVIPLTNVSSGGDARFLADGLTRDLTTLLSRTPHFRVAPPSSTQHFSANALNPAEAGEVLRVRFLITGTLARSGDSVRIRVELTDTADEALLWAEKYDARLDHFYEVQEEVVCSISTAIATKVDLTQPVRVRRTGRFNLSAYERVQAAESLRLNYGRKNALKIVEMLQEALEIEPDDPVTRAALAVQLSQNVVSQWAEEPKDTIARADALIADALAAAPTDPEVLAAAGIVATMFHRPDDAIRHLEVAAKRNPNDAHALAVLGWQQCLRHSDRGGIHLIETAETRAPHHPRFGLWATYRATAHLFMLDYAEGLRGGKQAVERTPNYYQPRLTCAWAYTGLGDGESAKREIARAREQESDDILEKFIHEMRRWSGNSPNKEDCWAVLEELRIK